jgi:hypothetical protein
MHSALAECANGSFEMQRDSAMLRPFGVASAYCEMIAAHFLTVTRGRLHQLRLSVCTVSHIAMPARWLAISSSDVRHRTSRRNPPG